MKGAVSLGAFALCAAAALAAGEAQAQPAAPAAPAAPSAGAPVTPVGPTVDKPAPDLVERFPPSAARWRIFAAGLSVTIVAYGGAALMGGLWKDIPGGDFLFAPVAGPWIALGKSGCAPDEETTEGQGDCEPLIGLRAAIYIVDGLLQLGGLGIIAESIFMTTESEDAKAPAKATILPAPIVTPTMVGVGVVGSF